jgi:hypothetical protein
MPFAPIGLAATGGSRPGEQRLRKDTGSRRTSGSRGEVPDDGRTEPGESTAGESTEPVEQQATDGGSTVRVPERVTPPPPAVEASELPDMPVPAARRVPEHGGASGQGGGFEQGGGVEHSAPSERTRSAPPPSFTPPATSLHSIALHAPEPVTGSAGPPGQTPPPMLPPMGGMGGPMGGMGGLAGRVEPERTRDVTLQEEPGAWDDDIGGAPAVLGRR